MPHRAWRAVGAETNLSVCSAPANVWLAENDDHNEAWHSSHCWTNQHAQLTPSSKNGHRFYF